MRILTNVWQIYRVSGLQHLAEAPIGTFPNYEYHLCIPEEVGRALADTLEDVELPDGRDILNDDGGYFVILDSKKDVTDANFGLMDPDMVEGVKLIETERGQRWMIAFFVANNETGITFAFNIEILDSSTLKKLMDRVEE
jgi:hypothetical protein